jgi:hypothetical protein
MAVGPNFQDPETQAAVAAQSATDATKADETGAAAAVNDSTPAAEPAEPAKVVEPAQPAESAETPSGDSPEPTESAATVTIEELRKMDSKQVNAELQKVGYTPESLSQELADNAGILPEATVEKLKSHFGDAAVDAVNDLQDQYAKAFPDAVKKATPKADPVSKMNDYIFGKLAGGDVEQGKAKLKELSDWAQKNLDGRQLKLINKKLASGDQDLVDEALEQAVGAWKKGQRTPMMTGDPAAVAANAAPEFKPLSRDEFKKIMSSEKYQTDLEYQEKIDARRRKTMETEGAMTPEFSHLRPPI